MASKSLLVCMIAAIMVIPGLGSDDKYTQPAVAPTETKVAAAATATATSKTATASASYNVQPVTGARLIFHGYYAGACVRDGFYVNGPYSLVVCSNGRAHVQPCAPGTRNAAVLNYVQGVAYQYSDFCSENLNDYAGTSKVVAASVPYYPVYGAYYPGYPFVYRV